MYPSIFTVLLVGVGRAEKHRSDGSSAARCGGSCLASQREPDSQLGSEPQSRLLGAFCSELHGRAERAAGAYAAMQPVDSIASSSSNFYISFRVNLDFQSFQILF